MPQWSNPKGHIFLGLFLFLAGSAVLPEPGYNTLLRFGCDVGADLLNHLRTLLIWRGLVLGCLNEPTNLVIPHLMVYGGIVILFLFQ